MAIDSIPARLYARAKEIGSEPAYYEKTSGEWVSTDWSTYAAQVTQAAKAMVALGVEPGHTVCILGFNRAEWVFDLAAMATEGARRHLHHLLSQRGPVHCGSLGGGSGSG